MCEGFQTGHSDGVLLNEVATYQRCPLTEVSPHKLSNSLLVDKSDMLE